MEKPTKPVVNGMKVTAPAYGRNCVRTLVRDGNSWAESRTANRPDENKTPYVRMVDGGDRNHEAKAGSASLCVRLVDQPPDSSYSRNLMRTQ